MTEAEWLAGTDPTPMLKAVMGTAPGRRPRLFLCACCRRHPDLYPDPRFWDAVAAAEFFADGLGTEAERDLAENATLAANDERSAEESYGFYLLTPAVSLCPEMQFEMVSGYARLVAEAADRDATFPGKLDELVAGQAALLRDIFGNPFRPVAFAPSWRTPTAVALAESIYADRAFDRLPVLADALEEAGCDNADILAHCRGDGPHARGCWVVDLVLGKE